MVISPFAAAVVLASASTGSSLRLSDAASIVVPAGVRVERRDATAGDSVFHLYAGAASTPLLSVHVGLHPAFPYFSLPSPDWAPPDASDIKSRVRRVHVQGRHGQETEWSLHDGSRGRELIVYLKDDGPPAVHFFYRGLKGAMRKAADGVIDSLRMK